MEKFFIALTVLIAIIAVQYKFDIQTTINVSNSGGLTIGAVPHVKAAPHAAHGAQGCSCVEEMLAEKKVPSFSYEGETGPAYWGDLRSEWITCSTGEQQSPIEISTDMRSPVITEFAAASAAPNPPVLSFSSDSAFQIKTAALNDIPQWACLQEAGGCGSLAFDGHSFQLLQFHFHTPSENTADGLHFPLEMHMVYCSGACQLGVDRFAVVGVLFELGPEEDTTPTTDLIEQMWAAVDQHMLNKDKDKSENVKAGQNQDPDSDGGDEFANRFTFDLSALFGKHNHYRATESFLHWKGSLTTPPCTEGLDWLLLNDIAPVDSDGTASPRLVQHIKPSQLARFLKQIKGYPGNSRPTQPLYGRNIIRY